MMYGTRKISAKKSSSVPIPKLFETLQCILYAKFRQKKDTLFLFLNFLR